ncbi:MAG: DUF1592 domain-containing protein [Nannocystis sp.]|nr:DUF1592 domain-containing protein [Nannocystis sp.]
MKISSDTLPLALTLALSALAACGRGEGDDSGDQGCDSDPEFFERHVWKPVLATRCISCHSSEGAAKATRMVLSGDNSEEALAANLATLREVARLESEGQPLLLLKPTNEHPQMHQGGAVLTRDSPEYVALEQWVARATGAYDCEGGADALACDQSGAGARRVRRLDHREYQQTLDALLRRAFTAPVTFAPDDVIDGYSNNASALKVSPLLAGQYREAAEAAADEIAADLAAFLPCDPVSVGEPECAAAFIKDFGRRAYRRPLSAAEQQRYEDLFKEFAAEDGFAPAIRWVSAAILQSPGFLYRTELGRADGQGHYALTPHELAAELSYLILGASPDDQLSQLADEGALSDPEVLVAEAERLLADPTSERMLHRFAEEWLKIGRLPLVTRDPALFPDLTPQLRADMLGETRKLFGALFREGGTLGELLTTSQTYLTPALAAYYGEAAGGQPDPDGFIKTNRTRGAGAGVLAHGSLLTTHALPTSSSPIHRGLVVRERLFCQHMPPPPPAVNASPPPVDPALSTRDRYAQHSSDPTCAGCHKLIDPIGFAFEHFDAAGRWRPTDGVHTIDDSGEVSHTQSTNAAFQGLAGLAAVLGDSEEVAACYVDQWSRFAIASAAPGDLACVEEELLGAFNAAEGRLDSLVLALVRSPYFRLRTGQIADGGLDPTGDTTADPTADTTGDTTTTGDPTDTADPTEDPTGGADPDAPPGIEFERKVDSMWPAGECDTVTVTNTSQAPITWYVVLTLQGALVNHWNAVATPEGDRTRFVGADYNATIQPNNSTSFGFCLEY